MDAVRVFLIAILVAPLAAAVAVYLLRKRLGPDLDASAYPGQLQDVAETQRRGSIGWLIDAVRARMTRKGY